MRGAASGLLIFLTCFTGAQAKECDADAPKGMLSRVVAIDSSKGDVYAGQKGADPANLPIALGDKEIVLTFDQGPHSYYTKNVLDVLDRHCVKATFFFAGGAASKYSYAVRDADRRGHTIAAAPWTPSANFENIGYEAARTEIEKGLAAVSKASGQGIAPFFRVSSPNLAPDVQAYLKESGVSLWRYDVAADDGDSGLTATKLANRTITRVQEAGKGVIQFHDTSRTTVDALDSILLNLKLGGYKVVHLVPIANYKPKGESVVQLAKPALLASVVTLGPSRGLVDSAKRRVRDGDEQGQRVQRSRRRAEREAAADRERATRGSMNRGYEQRPRELAAPAAYGYDRAYGSPARDADER
jgi:peptidoglycan-N-acetylglucosamine deacetylase